jgi:hypothetical protein
MELLATLLTVTRTQPKVAVLANYPQLATTAKGKLLKLIVDLAALGGFRAECHVLRAADFASPVDTERAIVLLVRDDLADKWGMPLRPSPEEKPRAVQLDDILLPADDLTHLWLQQEVTWTCNPELPAPPDLGGRAWKVGMVGSSTDAEHRVFRFAVPASKRSPSGPGGWSHLIAQKSVGLGRWIVRPMAAQELRRLFLPTPSPDRPLSPEFDGPLEEVGDGALAVPGNMMQAIVRSVVSFCQPVTRFRPRSLADVGLSQQVIRQWQDSMRTGHQDHMRMRRNGDCDIGLGPPPMGKHCKHQRRMSPEAACFPQAAPPSARNVVWFVADAIAAGDPSLIVPIQQWRAVSSHINIDMVRKLAIGFADLEVVDFLLKGTNQKNNAFTNQSALLPNAKTAEVGWYYVNKAFQEDLEQGLAIKFDVRHSPPFWPILTHPTGAVEKTDAEGRALTDEVRPTSDLSFKGSPIHEVIEAPNDSIMLDDPTMFPVLSCLSVQTMARKAIVLSLSGVQVRVAAYDMAKYYKQFMTQMISVSSHSRYWAEEDGASIIASLTMLFGCRAAASIASRGSALISYWLQLVMDLLPPAHPKARRWQDLQTWAVARKADGDPRFAKFHPYFHTGSADYFIDDHPLLALEGQETNIIRAFAALMQITRFNLQPKKCLVDGQFETSKKVLGVILDMSVSPFELRIPEAKIRKAVTRINGVLAGEWVEVKPIEELIGILAWIGSILIKAGSHLAFANTTLRASMRRRPRPARVTRGLRNELEWWLSLLSKWNRRSVIFEPSWTIPAHAADQAPFTDASRSLRCGGAGGVFKHFYFAWSWSLEELKCLDIMELEGLAHVLWLRWICHEHPTLVAGKRFISRCDNQAFVAATKKGRSSYPTIAFLLNQLHELQCLFSFEIQLVFVSSEDNVAADAASRFQWSRFFDFMLRSANIPRASLVQVQNIPKRSSWSCRMRQLKSWARATLPPQSPA